MAKTAKILLFVLGFAIILSIISNAFDYDFGWHLRFGQDVWSGHFPYLDTYTWSYQNKPWTNHEWGGDILYWWLYGRGGYLALVLFTSLSVWTAFLIVIKTYSKKISAIDMLVCAIAAWSVGHILVMRLSMLALPLFAVLLWSLEKIEGGRIKPVWLWPPLFWLWSALHGSWILGFITINIYLAGALLQRIAPASWQKFLPGKKWENRTFYYVVAAQLAGALVITVNPYGLKIWVEVLKYFSAGYLKAHIVEWLPSYTFPVYWKPLLMQAIGIALAAAAYLKQKISVRQLLLFAAFSFSAWMYKRNAMFVALLAVPLISGALTFASGEIRKNNFISAWLADKTVRKLLLFFAVGGLLCVNAYYVLTTRFSADIWRDQSFMEYNNMPFAAVEFLQKKAGTANIKIFNDYNWGGYLIWQMPRALVYLDGRSAATWTDGDGRLMLENYFTLMDNPGGLEELEKNKVEYVLIKKSNFLPMPPPDWINRIIFGGNLAKVVKIEKTRLEQDLSRSKNWRLIFTDKISNVWENDGG